MRINNNGKLRPFSLPHRYYGYSNNKKVRELINRDENIDNTKVLVKDLIASGEEKHETIGRLQALLSAARCPNSGCTLGITQYLGLSGLWEARKCHWCHDRDKAMDGYMNTVIAKAEHARKG